MVHLDVTDWALSVLVTLGALVLPVTLVTLSVLVTLGARVRVTGRPLAPASPRLTLGVLTSDDVSPGVFLVASPLVMLGVLVTEGVLMLPDLVTMAPRLTDGVLTTADVSPGIFLLVTGVAAFLLVTALVLEVFSGVEALLAPAAAAAAGLEM